jgi:glycosyltransferase involved in cell wall biosynthesis
MKLVVIIPFYNEEKYLAECIGSFVQQTRTPDLLILVDDSSTDKGTDIAKTLAATHPFIHYYRKQSDPRRMPGAKHIHAFHLGLDQIEDFDIIGKFDADIILPPNYFEKAMQAYRVNPNLGMFSGHLYIQKEDLWIYEAVADKNHIRGPIKLYSKKCFKAINGLIPALGWDSVDTLLAQASGFQLQTDDTLEVKHLRPTSKDYMNLEYFKHRGASYHLLGYDLTISLLSAVKLASKKKSLRIFNALLQGYFKSRGNDQRLVNDTSAKAICRVRYRKMARKLNLLAGLR